MASKNFRQGGNAIIYTALTIGILVLINVIASRFFTRLDLTEDQIYTISEASKKMVAGLPDRLTIKAFISSDLPPQVKSVARYLRDILGEYATASDGKVQWEVLDPSGNEKVKEEARRLKVQQAQLSVFEKSKASVSESYLGVAFTYGGKVESIPFVSDISNLEYEISSTIRRLISKKKKVGFTSGHGEPSLYQGMQAAQDGLKDYETTTVDLTEGKTPIPEDVDVLIVAGPRQPMADRALYELDQFLMKGKSLLVLLDGMTLETPRGNFQPDQVPPRIARANRVGLTDQLEYYGAKLGEDLIFDRQNARVVLPAAGGRRVITNYPAFPIVTDFNRDSQMTRNLQGVIPVFPGSVALTPESKDGKDGVKGVVLARSSKASWRQTGFFLFDAMRQPEPTKELGPFDLAVSLQGTFKSFWNGKPVPKAGPAKPMQEQSAKPSGSAQKSKPSARLVVVADAEFMQDQFLGLNPSNLHMLLNMVDVLAEDESLIAIRAKTQTRRPMEMVEDGTMTLVKYANVVGLPLAFIVLGVVRWRWRRVARRMRAERLLRG